MEGEEREEGEGRGEGEEGKEGGRRGEGEGTQEGEERDIMECLYTHLHTSSHPHINGCLLCEGSHRVYVVVQDDDAHHYSETEESCVLILKPR